jgi:hypothetical protein
MKYKITESGITHYKAEYKNCRGAFTEKMKLLDHFYQANLRNKPLVDLNECKKLALIEPNIALTYLTNKRYIESVNE